MNRGLKHAHRWLVATLCVAAVLISGCSTVAKAAQQDGAANMAPSRLEPIDGSELSRVILTDEAAKRLDIQTEAMRTEEVDGVQRTLVPYAALIYDVDGGTWVYTNPAPLTFVRASVDVDTIQGGMAMLSEGPPAGTAVVIVGGAELYGAEFEFQEG